MKLNDLYPSKYLSAADLDGDTVYTIVSVSVEELGQTRDRKPVAWFRETDKGLALNKTNATTIGALYGDDTDQWRNCQVTLFPTDVEFQGRMVQAVRVRSRAPLDQALGADNGSGSIPF